MLLALLATSVVLPLLGAQRADTLRLPLLWAVVEGERDTADSLGDLSGIGADLETGAMTVLRFGRR